MGPCAVTWHGVSQRSYIVHYSCLKSFLSSSETLLLCCSLLPFSPIPRWWVWQVSLLTLSVWQPLVGGCSSQSYHGYLHTLLKAGILPGTTTHFHWQLPQGHLLAMSLILPLVQSDIFLCSGVWQYMVRYNPSALIIRPLCIPLILNEYKNAVS